MKQETKFSDLRPGDRFRRGPLELVAVERFHELGPMHLACDPSSGRLYALAAKEPVEQRRRPARVRRG